MSRMYNPQKEIKVNLNDYRIRRIISKSKRTYNKFAKKFLHKIDLKNQNSIKQVYKEAFR